MAFTAIDDRLENNNCMSRPTMFKVFQLIDADKDGLISMDELDLYFSKLRLHVSSDTMLSLLIAEKYYDEEVHDLGHILDFGRFTRLCRSAFEQTNKQIEDESADEEGLLIDEGEKDLMEVFRLYDINGDGFISADEVGMVLRRLGFMNLSVGSTQRMIRKADTNRDGVLDFTEFKIMMRKERQTSIF